MNVLGCAIENRALVHVLLDAQCRVGGGLSKNAVSLLTLRATGSGCVPVVGMRRLHGFAKSRCTVVEAAEPQVVAVDVYGNAFVGCRRTGRREWLSGIDEPTLIQRVRNIRGRAYASGLHREVYRRSADGQWERLAEGLPAMTTETLVFSIPLAAGFRDVDGFSDADVYAAGGYGDVWHFDGARWTDCGFPEPMALIAICCGGDGQVYVSGEHGALFQGRGHRWRRIDAGRCATAFSELRWSLGRLWLYGDGGLYQLRDGRTEPVVLPGVAKDGEGVMDARDGVVCVADSRALALYDGVAWHSGSIAGVRRIPA